MGSNSTEDFVPFGCNKIQMHENHNFVLPVNKVTAFTHAPFSWAAR